jgi:hypothetical protein
MITVNLIDAYVYEVTRRLPLKSREDIALELRSIIDDMLSDNPTEKEIKDALSKLGDPAVLASRYSEKPMYLIGPKVYDIYIGTMKKIVPLAIILTVLVNIIVKFVDYSGEVAVLNVILGAFGEIIASTIMTLIHVFFWVTAVFVFLERVGISNINQPITKMGTPWTPEDLKLVEFIPKKKAITKGETIFGLVWTVLWAVAYFYADHLIGIYSSSANEGLQFIMPIFNQDVLLSYWPLIVTLIVLEVLLFIYKWNSKVWTMKNATANAVVHLLAIIVFVIITSNPNLFNPDIIPYMADIVNSSVGTVKYFMKWIWWIMVASFIITTLVEIYMTYRKARIVS